MIQSQISDDERHTFSDFTIKNDAGISALCPQINDINQKIFYAEIESLLPLWSDMV